jgi:hypothetical protein
MLPPACPHGACLLRASCSAAYTAEQIDRAANLIVGVVREASINRGAGAGSPSEHR